VKSTFIFEGKGDAQLDDTELGTLIAPKMRANRIAKMARENFVLFICFTVKIYCLSHQM
jgi:hypothetical protein